MIGRPRRWLALLLVVGLWSGCESENPGDSRSTGECPPEEGAFVQGRVFVPRAGRSGDAGAGGRFERPARDAPVTIYRSGSPETAVAEVETGADGSWCAALPESVELGVALIAKSEWEGVSLRRSLVASRGQIISVRSEALHRALYEQLDAPTSLSPATYLNLQAIASTAIDLLDPVRRRDGEAPPDLVDRAEGRLREDPRFSERLEALSESEGSK